MHWLVFQRILFNIFFLHFFESASLFPEMAHHYLNCMWNAKCIALLHQLLFMVLRKSSLLNNFAYGFKTGCIARRVRSVFAKSHIYALDRGDSNVLKLKMQWTNFAVHNEQFLCRSGWNVERELERTDSTCKRKPFIKFKFHIAKEIVKLIQLKLWRFSQLCRVDGRAPAHAWEKCTPCINTRVIPYFYFVSELGKLLCDMLDDWNWRRRWRRRRRQ